MALEKVMYTAHAKATGGRDGVAKSDDGKLEVKLDPLKGMGGGGTGTNPEQLFAAGYAACFIGALKFLAGTQKIHVPADTSIDSSVSLGLLVGGPRALESPWRWLYTSRGWTGSRQNAWFRRRTRCARTKTRHETTSMLSSPWLSAIRFQRN